MNLNQFKSWKLLFEDEELCFSSAVNSIDQLNVFFITFFNPEKISKATKHLMDAHLHNYVALLEEEGKLHLILKQQVGKSIKKFIKHSHLDYDDRVQIVYEYLKLIEKYDAFNNAIKIQLIDDEQLLISDDGLSIRELIDYTLNNTYSDLEVFKQLGITIDLILSDAEGYHSQFIDNLILGHHHYSSIKIIKKDFKDIFIFEKPDALETISLEYNIILNDLEAGPPLPYTKVPHKDSNPVPAATIDHQEELHRELFELLSKDVIQEDPSSNDKGNVKLFSKAEVNDIAAIDNLEHQTQIDLEEVDSQLESTTVLDQAALDIAALNVTALNETVGDEDIINGASVDENVVIDSEYLEENNEGDVNDADLNDESDDLTVSHTTDEKIDNSHITGQTASFKAQYADELSLPESLPKSSKHRSMDDEDLFDDDVFDLFEENETKDIEKRTFNSKWFIVPVCILLLALIIFFSSKILFSSEPIVVSFDVEPLQDNRIAFMNKTTGTKNIEAYSWEIYYHGTLIQTFTDKNLFPVFDTEGTYTIILKVEDKKGNWSEPYSLDYFVETTEQVTTTP